VRGLAAARAPTLGRTATPRDDRVAEAASESHVSASDLPLLALSLMEDLESSPTAAVALGDLVSADEWPQTDATAQLVVSTMMLHPAFTPLARRGILASLESNRMAAVARAQALASPERRIASVYPTSAAPCNIAVEDDPRRPGTAYCFALVVYWSDGTEAKILRSYSDFFNFQCKLLDLFPEDAEREPRAIPYLPGKKLLTMKKQRALAEDRVKPIVQQYVPDLLALEPRIAHCQHTVAFFQHCPKCRCLLADCRPNCTTAGGGVAMRGVRKGSKLSLKRFAKRAPKESEPALNSPRPVSLHEQQMDMFANPLRAQQNPAISPIREDDELPPLATEIPDDEVDAAAAAAAADLATKRASTLSEFVEMEETSIPMQELGGARPLSGHAGTDVKEATSV